MSGKNRVPAEELTYIAVGVPSGRRVAFTRRALTILGHAGFATKELSPEDIVAQGAHIIRIQTMAEQAKNTETNPQEN